MTWADLAREFGVSESGLRNIRVGRNEPSDLTKHRIEEALGWEPGSVEAVLDGGDPTPTNAKPAPQPEDNPYTDPAEREIWKLTELPESERLLYIQLLRERRRAAG